MGMMAGIVGGIGSLAGLFGGGTASSVPIPPQIPGVGDAAQGALSGIRGLQPFTDMSFSSIPFAQDVFGRQFNNPFAGGFQAGGNFAGGMGQGAAINAFNAGTGLEQFGSGVLPWATSLFNQGFDPQNALYNRTLQNVTEQTRAGLEARGINNTPYGAGVEGQTLGNFNIDWQNNQLQRMIAGAGGAGNLLNQGGAAINLGAGISNAAPGQFLVASQIPYGVYGNIAGDQSAAINQLLGTGTAGLNLANMPIQDYLSYMTGAGGLNNQATQLALQQNALNFNQQQALGGALGRSLYGIGGANKFNSPFLGGWGGGGITSMFG